MPGQSVVERAPEAVHVRMEIFPVTLNFFRGDIVRRAPDGRFVFFALGCRTGESEIDELRLAVLVKQDIARLDVAMKEIPLERALQCRSHLNPDIEHADFRYDAIADHPT